MIADYGIYLEMFGFLLLLLVANRSSVKIKVLAISTPKRDRIEKIREKIIPDRFISVVFLFGVCGIITGLVFQLEYFNPN